MNVKIKYLTNYTKLRNQVALKYDESLSKIPKIAIPKRVNNSTHVFHQYTLIVDETVDRNHFKEYLIKKGVPSMIYYPVPLHLQEAYLGYGGVNGQFPISENLSNRVLSLPIHTEMTDDEQKYIINQILNYFNE